MKLMPCLLVLLLVPFLTSHAQVLNKCVSASGTVSWQSSTCGPGTRQTRSIAYTPEAPTVVLTTVQPSVKPARKARWVRTSGYRSSTRMVSSRRDPCAQAKGRRESTLERAGLKRNYDLLSMLDAEVRRVCR